MLQLCICNNVVDRIATMHLQKHNSQSHYFKCKQELSDKRCKQKLGNKLQQTLHSYKKTCIKSKIEKQTNVKVFDKKDNVDFAIAQTAESNPKIEIKKFRQI